MSKSRSEELADRLGRLLNRIGAMLPMPWTSCLLMLLGAFVLVRFWMALVLQGSQ